jgi:hypothetical protein
MLTVPVTHYVKRRAGEVSTAHLLWDRAGLPCAGTSRGKSAAQNRGLRYEEKITEYLNSRYPYFLAQVPFRFTSGFVTEKCILDGLLWSKPGEKEVVMVEIKSRHTADAWFQLRYLYFPVVQAAFPGWDIRLLEICRTFEPVALPEPYKLHMSVDQFLDEGTGYGVVCKR